MRNDALASSSPGTRLGLLSDLFFPYLPFLFLFLTVMASNLVALVTSGNALAPSSFLLVVRHPIAPFGSRCPRAKEPASLQWLQIPTTSREPREFDVSSRPHDGAGTDQLQGDTRRDATTGERKGLKV